MCMKENLIHSRTCVYNINYHVVWSVKYRRKILSAEIETYLKELVQKIASDKGFSVHLFEVGEGDHIHCFVSAPPKMSVTDIVKYLKGITGRKLFEKYPAIRPLQGDLYSPAGAGGRASDADAGQRSRRGLVRRLHKVGRLRRYR